MLLVKYNNAEFYTSLACLFYAMAISDRKIARQEKVKIRELVENYWSVVTPELDSTTIIYQTLEKLIDRNTDKEEALAQFREFFTENKELYPKEVRNTIIDNADRIALAYAGRNKSESVLLYQLYKMLKG